MNRRERLVSQRFEPLRHFSAPLANLAEPFNAGRTFQLSVHFETKGENRFPVLELTEGAMDVNTPEDVTKADALVQLMNNRTRLGLAAYLDETAPGWMTNQPLVAKLNDIGWQQAVENIIKDNR